MKFITILVLFFGLNSLAEQKSQCNPLNTDSLQEMRAQTSELRSKIADAYSGNYAIVDKSQNFDLEIENLTTNLKGRTVELRSLLDCYYSIGKLKLSELQKIELQDIKVQLKEVRSYQDSGGLKRSEFDEVYDILDQALLTYKELDKAEMVP